MPTPEENAAIRALETEDERKAREQAGLTDTPKRGPGRHKADCTCGNCGNSKKPKMSDSALDAGCMSLVRFCWMLSNAGAFVLGGKMRDLTPAEMDSGAQEAKNLVLRFAFLATVLMIIGFPIWLIGMVVTHFERRAVKPASQLTIVAEPAATEATHGTD